MEFSRYCRRKAEKREKEKVGTRICQLPIYSAYRLPLALSNSERHSMIAEVRAGAKQKYMAPW